MNIHADKTQEDKSQSIANGESRMQSSGESTFKFVDNRPEAIAQRKLKEIANNSPRAMQLKAFQDMATQPIITIQRAEGDLELGSKPNVVQIAKDGVNNKPPQLFSNLSSKMCWDAVLYCGYLAKLTDQEENGKNIIDSSASLVTNSSGIPSGNIIGFFHDGDLKHAMISTGSGNAAGNKNDCMGIGNPVGWEELRLPAVNENGEFIPEGQARTIIMRHQSF
jgi:hypothetical protein